VLLLSSLSCLVAAAGCTGHAGGISGDQPDLKACAEIVLPNAIKLQPWTRPVSFAADGKADGLEVLLAAYDALGDETKALGTLHLELFARRMASADRLGRRLALWKVNLDSRDHVVPHWDQSVHFSRFHVRLSDAPLEPGRYVLVARLLTPTGHRLSDEHEFTLEAGATVLPVSGP
jgi:hypothetical protein